MARAVGRAFLERAIDASVLIASARAHGSARVVAVACVAVEPGKRSRGSAAFGAASLITAGHHAIDTGVDPGAGEFTRFFAAANRRVATRVVPRTIDAAGPIRRTLDALITRCRSGAIDETNAPTAPAGASGRTGTCTRNDPTFVPHGIHARVTRVVVPYPGDARGRARTRRGRRRGGGRSAGGRAPPHAGGGVVARRIGSARTRGRARVARASPHRPAGARASPPRTAGARAPPRGSHVARIAARRASGVHRARGLGTFVASRRGVGLFTFTPGGQVR